MSYSRGDNGSLRRERLVFKSVRAKPSNVSPQFFSILRSCVHRDLASLLSRIRECEIVKNASSDEVVISKSFDNLRELFDHANVRSTTHLFGIMTHLGTIFSEISTLKPSLDETSATNDFRYPSSPQNFFMVGYFSKAFLAGFIPDFVS